MRVRFGGASVGLGLGLRGISRIRVRVRFGGASVGLGLGLEGHQ